MAVERDAPVTPDEIRNLIESDFDSLLARAYAVKKSFFGGRVALRGLVEFSNVCGKNCLYCGIRRDNAGVVRYRMSEDEIVDSAAWAADNGYGSVVLQSGEIKSDDNTAFVERVLSRLHKRFGDSFGVTLSLGEQTRETYARWRDAGAHRYLLRIETSSPELYARLHPADHSWTTRRDCLHTLRELGYVVGSGVMIGLPGQTTSDLANDIRFFRDEDIDMIGMGPFIPTPGTPLGAAEGTPDAPRRLELALRMIAVTRICLGNVNIAAATALQAINPEGREKGLLAGANVVMPNVTPRKYREDYLLYPGKPCTGENSEECRSCLARRIASIGEEIAWGERADPPHFRERMS